MTTSSSLTRFDPAKFPPGAEAAAQVSAALQAVAEPARAPDMARYMRDLFPFYGVPTPARRRATRPMLRALATALAADWEFVTACWQAPQREMQYVACDHLVAVQRYLTPAELPRLARLVQEKSWWDTIDQLDRVVGTIILNYPQARPTILDWAVHEDFWMRRIAIDHQLSAKNATDRKLLAQIIELNLGSSEFFINKAIGWALRDFARTDPNWVRAFVEEHRQRLAPLSIREATKHL